MIQEDSIMLPIHRSMQQRPGYQQQKKHQKESQLKKRSTGYRDIHPHNSDFGQIESDKQGQAR